MVYSAHPPYEILQTKLIDFATMQRLRRFARFWDLIGNSGNFVATTPLIWRDASSPFTEFMRLSDWLHAKLGRHHGIPLAQLGELLFIFLTEEKKLSPPSSRMQSGPIIKPAAAATSRCSSVLICRRVPSHAVNALPTAPQFPNARNDTWRKKQRKIFAS